MMQTTSFTPTATAAWRRPGRLGRRAKQSVVAAVVSMAVLGLLAVVLAGLGTLLGWRTVVITSGSMEPAVQTGDAILLREGAGHTARVGDVVTFQPLREEHLTTHRVIGHQDIRGTLHLQTQGDANDYPDPNLVPADNVVGTMALRLPGLGVPLAHAVSPIGRLLLIGIPAGLLILDSLRSVRGDRSPSPVR